MVFVDPPVSQERVEELLQKLFDLHDLKANGVLEEELRSWLGERTREVGNMGL